MTRQLLPFALALSCVCGVGALTPSVSCAAEPAQKVARLGFVGLESPSTTLRGVKTFWERLRELGWIRGQNLVVEERWAEGRVERLPGLMNEVIAQNVDVLFTYHTPAAVAAKSATNTVPIVAAWMGDPVGAGLAASQSRPGGNLTGISLAFDEEFSGKWLELLHETVPRLSTVAVIGNPASPWVRKVMSELETAARTQRLALRFMEVRDAQGLDQAFDRAHREVQGALVLGDPLTLHNLQRIQSLAAKQRMPTMYTNLEFAALGGLMAYGADSVIVFRRAAEYVDKLFRGAKPADLPIEQPTQYLLVVNLRTAKELGITIPESILVRADEVIR